MSQPRQLTPSHSPTPSKSSLRRTSGTQNPSQRSLIPPPSPHFEDQPPATVRYSPRSPPNQTLEYESDEDDEPLIYPDIPAAPGDESYFPHSDPERPFQPFFTLIEDGLTSEHHHPSVYYIFADDDAEIVTEAALRSLEQDTLAGSSTAGDPSAQQSGPDNPLHNESRLPPPTEGVREHFLVLDVQPISPTQAQQQRVQTQTQSSSQNTMSQPDILPSYAVTGFTSFSPDWQITSAAITSAPTMGETPGDDEGLMLRIQGRGLPALEDIEPPVRAGKAPVGHGSGEEKDANGATRARETLEDMIERFQSGLRDIKTLVEMDTGVSNPYHEVRAHVGIGDAAGDGAMYSREESDTLTGIGLEEQD